MSDASVVDALRSPARLVVVEAPAGCGKTFQGAQYACDVAEKQADSRVLILTHTHAACDEFASRTRGIERRVEIRTIDSLIAQVAAAYHPALGFPADVSAWARSQKDGYNQLAVRVARLLSVSPMIAHSLAQRYGVVICDEHQDASAAQHATVMACHQGGALLRIFGDPMQRIYGSKKQNDIAADNLRWETLKQEAQIFDELDEPHRWSDGSIDLGRWILAARTTLRAGGQIDLRGTLPLGVSLIFADNQSPKARGGYLLTQQHAQPIYALERTANSVLVLATQNETVNSLRAFFNRRLPIWEGHVRESLTALVSSLQNHNGDPENITQSVITFLDSVATGFSPSAYGNTLLSEVRRGCAPNRLGKPGKLQALGRIIIEQPNHKGVAKMLRTLGELASTDPVFDKVKIDYRREYWEAVRIGQFDDPEVGFAELSHRRGYTRPSPPVKAISTVHKAKGLQRSDVLVMPCDAQHFGDTEAARCRLYVAISRAMRSLTLVISRRNPSPLFQL